MKTKIILPLLFAAAAAHAQPAADKAPTMGWSSWNTFALNISDAIIRAQADAMVDGGFLQAGYRYLNIDDGYFGGRDADGHLLIHPTRFPNGMRPVVDYIHAKGLKAGIYSDAGHDTCGSYWGGDKIGIGVGLYGHDQEDCNFFFKDLNFDFIKVDYCGGNAHDNKDKLQLPEEERYRAIWAAIQQTGRTDVRMNVCRWAFPGTWVHDVCTSWRTTADIECSWTSVKAILKENFYLSAYATDGKYNDMDMLEVGRTLSAEEDKTHFGMWCIMASPLLIGCDVATVSEESRALLCNPELIALNQDTLCRQAYVVSRSGEQYVLVKDIEQNQGTARAVALCNLGNSAAQMTVRFADVDLDGAVRVRDLFAREDVAAAATGAYTATVPAHGTRIYRLEAATRKERTCYEAEAAWLSAYQELQNNEALPSAIWQENNACHGGACVGWLGRNAGNDLQWRDVWSQTGGQYTLTLQYCTGENRDITVEVNGQQVYNGPLNSGGWSTWGAKAFTGVRLNKGANTVRIYNASGWMPDIDCLNVVCTLPDGIAAVAADRAAAPAGVYSLDGKRLADDAEGLPAGLYVVDGKKQARQ